MRYKGESRKSLQEIARELSADAILQGTVTLSGSKVRITTQLIRTQDDRHLWSERYVRDLADLLSLALSIQPTWTSMTADLNTLSAFAVEYRYPGDSADLSEAREAFQKCEDVRGIIRQTLHL
jgi:hypothetical protein